MVDVCFGKNITQFNISNSDDVIQKYHLNGQFYEVNQLTRHLDLIWYGSTVLDIGSNIGNHALFYAANSRADKVFLFEPNISARNRLLDNIELNQNLKNKFCLDYLEYGVGSSPSIAYVGHEHADNLGATRLVKDLSDSSSQNPVNILSLDSINLPSNISFVKIDTEGYEIEVLRGGHNLFTNIRPYISIEIGWWNEADFEAWLTTYGYKVIALFQDTEGVRNYLLYPNIGK